MRILPITHGLCASCLQGIGGGEVVPYYSCIVCAETRITDASQIIRNGAIIFCGVLKGPHRQLETRIITEPAVMLRHFLNNWIVVSRIDHNTHRGVIFGRGAQ